MGIELHAKWHQKQMTSLIHNMVIFFTSGLVMTNGFLFSSADSSVVTLPSVSKRGWSRGSWFAERISGTGFPEGPFLKD